MAWTCLVSRPRPKGVYRFHVHRPRVTVVEQRSDAAISAQVVGAVRRKKYRYKNRNLGVTNGVHTYNGAKLLHDVQAIEISG